jgi:hypothetical protein
VDRVAAERRFFHCELEFPEVFFDHGGERRPSAGFDAVLGNPPWEMIRADAGSASERAVSHERLNAVLRFTRDSGSYEARSTGHANSYQLFVERAVALTRPGGRIGLVLPSGFAADHGSAALRRLFFARCAVDSLIGFDNRHRLFPIHRSVRFHLLTATSGAPTTAISCRLGESDPAVLEAGHEVSEADHSAATRPVRLDVDVLRRLSGDDLTIPELKSSLDLAIAEKAATLFPPLGDVSGWNARFGRELIATEDRGSFMARSDTLDRLPVGGTERLPVIEGKAIQPFRVAADTSKWTIARHDADRLLGARCGRPRLAYRDVAGATNRVTLIAAILPSGCVSTHTVFCLRTRLPPDDQFVLCGLFNSLVVNYLVRLRVATHVTTAIVERLPIPLRGAGPAMLRRIGVAARWLSRHPVDDSSQAARRISALVALNVTEAQLYRLSRPELDHVLSSFPLIEAVLHDGVRRGFVEGA